MTSQPKPKCSTPRPRPPRQSTQSLPAWHRERAQRLKAAVLHLHSLRQRGLKIIPAVASTLRKHPRHKLKSNPRRRVPLSKASLLRHYYAWLMWGDVVFQLFIPMRRPVITEAQTIAFLNFVLRRRRAKAFAALWAEFCRNHQPEQPDPEAPLLVASPLVWFRRLQQKLALLPNVSHGTQGAASERRGT